MTSAEITDRLRVLLDAMQARTDEMITSADYRLILAMNRIDALTWLLPDEEDPHHSPHDPHASSDALTRVRHTERDLSTTVRHMAIDLSRIEADVQAITTDVDVIGAELVKLRDIVAQGGDPAAQAAVNALADKVDILRGALDALATPAA